MLKGEMLYEGKAKRVYRTDKEDVYYISYKDDATAFNGVKKGTIKGKSAINNTMSSILFKMLEERGIPTHYIEQVNETDSLVRAVEIVPLEVIVRNYSAGSMSKRFGVEEGLPLDPIVLEFSYKNDSLGDPLINELHALALKLATEEEISTIKELALKINEYLKEILIDLDLKLIDFKLEFGRYNGKIVLADEISPDTCRLWDVHTNEKLDKDRFRRDLGSVEEGYQEVLKRLLNE